MIKITVYLLIHKLEPPFCFGSSQHMGYDTGHQCYSNADMWHSIIIPAKGNLAQNTEYTSFHGMDTTKYKTSCRPFVLGCHIRICPYTSVWWLPFWVVEMYCSDWEIDVNHIALHQRKWLLQQDKHIYKSCWSSHLHWWIVIQLTPFLNHCNAFLPLKMAATILISIRTYMSNAKGLLVAP